MSWIVPIACALVGIIVIVYVGGLVGLLIGVLFLLVALAMFAQGRV